MNAPISQSLTGRELYVANRAKFTAEDMLPYAGHWMAWSKEGDRVLAHHADLGEVVRAVEAMGLTCTDVVLDQLPEGGEPEGIL